MAGLRIAMINGIKPMAGAGDGVTEYAYRMYLEIRKRNLVDRIYAIGRARKNDVLGLLKVNASLSANAKAAAAEGYDIFHVVNQEVGFVARDVKSVDGSNRVVTTVHDLSRFQKGLSRGALQDAYNVMVRSSVEKAVRHSDFLVFDSTQTMQDARSRFGLGRHAVVNLGIDHKFISKRRRTENRTTDDFLVGYVGSFAYHKNAMMALKAARLLKDSSVKFDIYGIGNEYSNLQKYKAMHGLHNVDMRGFAPESRKVSIYDSFDVFVFPSLYEGFGLPILEAQARGLPVIIYKGGRIPEEVRRYCFVANDPEHMVQIILDLKGKGYARRKRDKAMTHARSFTWERCAKETLKVYEQVLSR